MDGYRFNEVILFPEGKLVRGVQSPNPDWTVLDICSSEENYIRFTYWNFPKTIKKLSQNFILGLFGCEGFDYQFNKKNPMRRWMKKYLKLCVRKIALFADQFL
ncbi:MAG: hypothetical protein ACOCXG_03640 [Nanoarchaeota archaeon]